MNSRASKNIAMSKGKSIAKLIVGGVKSVGQAYAKRHKAKQSKINNYGPVAIFK